MQDKCKRQTKNWPMKEHRIGMRVGIGMPIIEAPSHRYIYIYISAAGRKSKCGKVLGQWKRKNKKLIEALAPYLMSINFLALKSNQFSCQTKAGGSHLDEAGKAEKRV